MAAAFRATTQILEESEASVGKKRWQDSTGQMAKIRLSHQQIA
jgi:hypothetical protein